MPATTGENGWAAAHRRVQRLHGSAKLHACCQCGGPAHEWAYDLYDLNEVCDARGRYFSRDPEHYQPVCRTCHKRMDGDYADLLYLLSPEHEHRMRALSQNELEWRLSPAPK